MVPKKTGDLQPVIDLSTLNRHMLVPHLKMEMQGSIHSAITSQEWTVWLDIQDAYLHVPMHQAVHKYLRFVVNKKVFTCLPFGLATSVREFIKLLRPVVALLRQQGVKLHIYWDDWLIRADTPEQAKLHDQTTIRVLQFLGWIINYEKLDLTPSQDFQFIGMQFNTRQFTVAPLPKMRLEVKSVHQDWMTNLNITASDLHRLLGMLVFMVSLVQRVRLRLRPVQWWAATAWCQRTRSWSDGIQVPQWVLPEVAWWASPAVLQGLHLATCHQGDGSDSLHGCVQFGLGSPVRLTLDTGTVVIISKIVAHQRFGDADPHQRCGRLSASSEVLGGLLDVRQRSDCGLHQERGGARDRTIWCRWPYDCSSGATFVPVHLPGVHNIQADSLSRIGQTLTTEWTMAMERLRPVFAEWGEPHVDLFATFTNRRLIKFVSPYTDTRTEWTDAMGQLEAPPVRVQAIQDGRSSFAEDRSVSRC